MAVSAAQASIDERNMAFWNELCGSHLAKSLGVHDDSKESLEKFDSWYLDIYPYLAKYIPYASMKGKEVLEIGLGYGTISQKIAEAGALYHGLDIAEGPVNMVNHRLRQGGLAGSARQGSILQCPFEDNFFDHLVSIGCFHHTGNLQRALDETWRVLKPGGRAMIMVYNAYSYRRWMQFGATLRYFLWDKFGIGAAPGISEAERAGYDTSAEKGVAAPETVFTSAAHFRRMAQKWSSCKIARENIGEYPGFMTRDTACRLIGPLLGLDLYCSLQK